MRSRWTLITALGLCAAGLARAEEPAPPAKAAPPKTLADAENEVAFDAHLFFQSDSGGNPVQREGVRFEGERLAIKLQVTPTVRLEASVAIATLEDGGAAPEPPAPGPRHEEPTQRRRPLADGGNELGTTYEVVVFSDLSEHRGRDDLAAARAVCREQEAIFSEWRADSEVSRLNRAGEAKVHPDLATLLAAALEVTRATGGAFDVTWFAFAPVWNRAAERGTPPTDAELRVARAKVGPDKLVVEGRRVRLAQGARIGLGGVAKGWIVDAVFRDLRARGYDDLIVNIGGDLRAGGFGLGGRPHSLRITDPFDTERTAATIDVMDRAVATSGNYANKRRIGDVAFGHLLDPRTGRPAAFDGSVTVLTRDAAMADALATALFVLGPERGLALARRMADVDAIYVTREGVRSTLD